MRQLLLLALLFVFDPSNASGISITLDYTLDEQNENWFDLGTPIGRSRRESVNASASFLSAIIINDDWQPLSNLNESITFSDIKAGTIKGLSGNTLIGSPESDGEGYAYSNSSNNVDITNRSSIGANEYVIYVGAFEFDNGTTSNAKGGSDSNDRRNTAGFMQTEFNTWGGKIYFNTAKTWYSGSNPALNPADNYGIQDADESPAFDTPVDNWDWSTSSDSWKGFQLTTIDPSADGLRDLYATSMHEMMHALGATTSKIEDYVGVNNDGNFIGTNLVAEYGGPVPGAGGHFAVNTQSIVWNSDDIISETVLDPNSLSGVRKYFTRLDAALLQDLGYQVLDSLKESDFDGSGEVNGADLAFWQDKYSSSGQADTNGNFLSDGSDFLIWQRQFQATVNLDSAATSVVPEPNTLLIFLVFCICILSANDPIGSRTNAEKHEFQDSSSS